ncbi:hypothetical protein BDR22DRAFT_894105 [Usnea florida]
MPASSNPPCAPTRTHNLTAAFLFLRTASTAVTNLTAQIASTKASLQSRTQINHHAETITYHTTQLETEQRDLKMWEARLVEAGVGVVNWVAKERLGERWLPGEILGMIGERLRGDDGLVLPGVW